MASWQEELAELLRELGVTQEEPKTHLQSPRLNRNDVKHRAQTHKQREQHEQSVDAFILEDIAADAERRCHGGLTRLAQARSRFAASSD